MKFHDVEINKKLEKKKHCAKINKSWKKINELRIWPITKQQKGRGHRTHAREINNFSSGIKVLCSK